MPQPPREAARLAVPAAQGQLGRSTALLRQRAGLRTLRQLQHLRQGHRIGDRRRDRFAAGRYRRWAGRSPSSCRASDDLPGTARPARRRSGSDWAARGREWRRSARASWDCSSGPMTMRCRSVSGIFKAVEVGAHRDPGACRFAGKAVRAWRLARSHIRRRP